MTGYSRTEQKEEIRLELRKFFEVAHWATKRQTQLFIRGVAPPRDGPIEEELLRMERRKMLRVVQNKVTDPKYYALPRKTKNFNPLDAVRLYHGLACTECMVRFYRSNTDCEVFPERAFRGLGSVPEGGILYGEVKDEFGKVLRNPSLLVYEFSTKHDVSYPLNMIGKFQAYDRNRENINEAFKAKTGLFSSGISPGFL